MRARWLGFMCVGGALCAPLSSVFAQVTAQTEDIAPLEVVQTNGSVVLDLVDGWKTYAPDPGLYGYPPVVTVIESSNVAHWSLDWPAAGPQESFGVPFLGYAADVVIPLSVVLVDENSPSRLVLAWNVAACAHVCLPVDARTVWESDPSTR